MLVYTALKATGKMQLTQQTRQHETSNIAICRGTGADLTAQFPYLALVTFYLKLQFL